MFESLRAPAPDKILHLMKAFAEDPRPGKIDLGVGVYRDAAGHTPIMQAVRHAEGRILASQTSKGYVAIAGDPAFHAAISNLVLGDAVDPARIAALATVGGTGAVRQAFELVRLRHPATTVWLTDPTWPNHEAILTTLGLRFRHFRYADRHNGTLDRAGMMDDLAGMAAGDVILLHGCCHNPTGIDPAPDDWQALAALAAERGALPVVDVAYQGFGGEPDADAAGLRALVRAVPEALITVSGSKNFGMYRDRVGLLLAICGESGGRAAVQATLAWLNRQVYTFPPDHGARVVTEVLTDPGLRAGWLDELSQMRGRVGAMRQALAAALAAETGTPRFDFLTGQKGLFSLIGAKPAEVEALRRDHALYMVGDGRINLAGLTPDTVAPAARAIAQALG